MGKTIRNGDIQKAYKKEIDLKTKTIASKKHKKPKYKGKWEDASF